MSFFHGIHKTRIKTVAVDEMISISVPSMAFCYKFDDITLTSGLFSRSWATEEMQLVFTGWVELPMITKMDLMNPLTACTWWRNFSIDAAAAVKPHTFQYLSSTLWRLLPPPSPPSKAACKILEGPGWHHFLDRWRTPETTAQLAPLVLWSSPPLPPSVLQAAGYCRCNRSWSCPLPPLISWRRPEGWWSWSTSSPLWPPRGPVNGLGSPHSHRPGLSSTAWWRRWHFLQ